MLMGVTVAASNADAATPSTGTLTLQIYYTLNGSQVAVANTSEYTQVTYVNGIQATSPGSGPNPTFSGLNYGNYLVTQSPKLVSVAGHGKSIANGMTTNVTISSATQTRIIDIPINVTHVVKLNVTGIPSGESAAVSFLTASRFQFLAPMSVTSGTIYNVSLPTGTVFASVNYASAAYTFEKKILAAQTTLNLNLQNGTGVFGFVHTTDGKPISGVTAVIFNGTSNHYSVSKFTGSYYTVYSNDWTGKTLILSANGYTPYVTSSVTPGTVLNVNLTPENSTINYNYSLSGDMKTLSLSISYSIGPGTTIPQLPNATVNSLSKQLTLDHVGASYMTGFLNGLMLHYTNNTIEVANISYALNSTPSVSIKSLNPSSSTAYFNATVTATYINTTINAAKLKTGFQVKIYAFGKTYNSGTLNTDYSFKYNNTNLALSKSTAKATTFVSPIEIGAQATSGWIYLTLSQVKEPKFFNTQISLYWAGLTSKNYLLNTSSHPAFIVPENVPVSFNMSKALYNPVTGAYDYLPPASFNWTINNVNYGTGYNFTHAFTAMNNTVDVTGVSNTGNTTSTFFTVYAYNGTPSVNYSVSFNGKVKYTNNVSSTQIQISVPQSAIITFSLYNSSIVIPNTNGMKVPLLYNWSFNDSSFNSPNVTYVFKKPSVAVPNQMANVTVSGITGGSMTFAFKVHVNDTTPPTPVIVMTGPTGKTIGNPTAGQVVNFSATKSTDPYYGSSYPLQYNWTFHYPNGTAIKNGSGVFTVKYGNLSSAKVGIMFKTLNTVIVQLNVTNHENVTGILNKSLTMVLSSPRIVVNSVYIPGSLQQGKTTTIYVNATNQGTVNAKSFYITVLINGAVQHTQFYNSPLNKSQTRNLSFTWNPGISGSQTLQFIGNNTSEPTWLPTQGSFSKSVSIAAPGYKTPLIIAGIIAVIVVVGIVYWRLSSGGLRRTKPAEQPKSKVSLPSEQKKLEKKK